MQDKQGNLLPYFITVCNIDSQDSAEVIAGNERVILPRLSDAAFFWQQDRKQSLADRRQQLSTIIFQDKLGTLFDKSARVAELTALIAKDINGDSQLAKRAAWLAKCDLMTDMVGEFPDFAGRDGLLLCKSRW